MPPELSSSWEKKAIALELSSAQIVQSYACQIRRSRNRVPPPVGKAVTPELSSTFYDCIILCSSDFVGNYKNKTKYKFPNIVLNFCILST